MEVRNFLQFKVIVATIILAGKIREIGILKKINRLKQSIKLKGIAHSLTQNGRKSAEFQHNFQCISHNFMHFDQTLWWIPIDCWKIYLESSINFLKKVARNGIHIFLSFFQLAKNVILVFGGFLACKKWNSCFLRFLKLAKNEIHVFGSFLSLQKNEFLDFWGFLSLQKMKFMFFEVFKLAKNEIHVFSGF